MLRRLARRLVEMTWERLGGMRVQPRERLILALDLPTVARPRRWSRAAAARSASTRSAISLPLPAACRLPSAGACGTQVFLDMKLHDIGNTVANGVASIAAMGVDFLTVHAYPQTMQAAVEARGDVGSEDPRRHRADVLRRCRSCRRGLRHRGRRTGRRARRAGARNRRRRHRLFGRGGGAAARHRRTGHAAGDAGHPPGRQPMPATRSAS